MRLNAFQTMRKIYISSSKEIVVDTFENEDGKEIKVKHELGFIDSFKFMAPSLDSLVRNLYLDKFIQTKKVFKDKFKRCFT